ncbi:MAG: RNA polymerase sigma factor [Actinomycetota bacterium]
MEGRPLEDAELVERARDGDVQAYEALVDRYQQLAYRTAYLVTRDTGEAEDAAQEGFVKAYYALARFRRASPFKPWLLAIVANEAKNRVRSASRRGGLALRLEQNRAPGDAAPSPEGAALLGERQRMLLAALETLSERDRLVIAYRYFFDLSEAEMADALGCAPGTVKSRAARALDRLRAVLGDQMVEPT